MAETSDGIRIVVINGSVRPGNYTGMASALVVDALRKQPIRENLCPWVTLERLLRTGGA